MKNIDMEQFGISDINSWYDNVNERRTSAQDIVLSLVSDVQHLMGDPQNDLRINFMLNRIKWLTMNKLDNK